MIMDLEWKKILLSRRMTALAEAIKSPNKCKGKLELEYDTADIANEIFIRFMKEGLGCSQNGTKITVYFE